MDTASGYSNSKRPPKLRSACNECHAAKVRCSGEKTGCQRCSNLRLKCAFSISRIGKVPGKRSKANRVAAAVATSTSSSSAPIATSSSAPIVSPPLITPSHSFENSGAYDGRNKMPVSTGSYPFTQEYPTSTHPFSSEAHPPHFLPGYPSQSHPEDLSNLSNLCWTTELDQLGGPGLLSPEWDIDADESVPLASHKAATSTSAYPNLSPDESIAKPYATAAELLPSAQCTVYIHLLHSIEQTIQFSSHCSSPGCENIPASTLDSILAANERYLTTLLQVTDRPNFTHTYNSEHLLFSVALDRIIHLFGVGYTDFRRRVELHEGTGMGYTGPVDRWVRFGAFEIDFVEQMAMCRRVFVHELKRARNCLGRLMDAMGCVSMPVATTARHEGLCEEMKKKLDGLMDNLEGIHTIQGVHLVG